MPPVQMYREVQVDPQNEVQSESSSISAASHQSSSFYFAAAGVFACRCDLRCEI